MRRLSGEEIHALEKRALTGDQNALVDLVSAFRVYRQSAEHLLSQKSADQAALRTALTVFESTVAVAWP